MPMSAHPVTLSVNQTSAVPRVCSARAHVCGNISDVAHDEVAVDGGPYYVYGLIDPLEYRTHRSPLLAVFYVGKGVKSRAGQHEKDQIAALNRDWNNIAPHGSKAERIRGLISRGEQIPAIMLSTGYVNDDDAYKAETLAMTLIDRLLASHGLPPLTNNASGHGQNQGLNVIGSTVEPNKRPAHSVPAPVERIHGEPEFDWPTVAEQLKMSTSYRRPWTDVIKHSTIVVKGNADELAGGTHQPLPPAQHAHDAPDFGPRVNSFESDFLPGSETVRRGYDPDNPWDDYEARARAARYWPISAALVRDWLESPETMPTDLLLTIPATGGTTVRYAWRLDPKGHLEYYPETGRWGLPLGPRLPKHAALGVCLTERRDGRDDEVQLLMNYASGIRIVTPSPR